MSPFMTNSVLAAEPRSKLQDGCLPPHEFFNLQRTKTQFQQIGRHLVYVCWAMLSLYTYSVSQEPVIT